MHSTLIVVPCYNEAARLDTAAFDRFLTSQIAHRKSPIANGESPIPIANCKSPIANVEFLFVDDGSADATADVVRTLATRWPEHVHFLQLPQNRGKAEAVRAGVLDAARREPGVIGYWDADLATPLSEIVPMAERFADSQVTLVIGSRVRMLGRDIRRTTFRHLTGRVFATFASLQLRLPVYDTQCGAKLFRVTPATIRLFERPFRLRWCFDVEVLARFTSPGVNGVCVEHPVACWADVGASKLDARQAFRVVNELIRIPSVVRDERARR